MKYEKWYDQKKQNNANLLYEKLNKVFINKKILKEEESSPSKESPSIYKKAAEMFANGMRIDTGTDKGKKYLDFLSSTFKKVKKAGKFEPEHIKDIIFSSLPMLGDTILKMTRGGSLNENILLKEGWIDSLGNLLLGNMGKIAIFFGIIEPTIEELNPYVKEAVPGFGRGLVNLSKGAEGVGGIAQNVGQTGQEATQKLKDAIMTTNCVRSTPGYRPGMKTFPEQWYLTQQPGYSNPHIFQVGEIDPKTGNGQIKQMIYCREGLK